MTNLDFFIKCWVTFFVVIGPLDIMIIFAALVNSKKESEHNKIAVKSNLIAFFILIFFMFFGMKLLSSIGISIDALRISGGLLLMIIAYKMLFDSSSHTMEYDNSNIDDSNLKNNIDESTLDDVSVFPLATPLLAGAGAMSAVVLFTVDAGNDNIKYSLVGLSFGSVLLLNCILCILYLKIQKYLGMTIINIITRITGILLAALSLQFILDGLKGAGVF